MLRYWLILCICILWLFGALYIRSRLRYLFMIIFLLWWIFSLWLLILPLYDYSPTQGINDFYSQQSPQIIIQWNILTWSLLLKTDEWKRQIFPQDLQWTRNIDLSKTTEISYQSRQSTGDQLLFIQTPDGSLLGLTPQSAIIAQNRDLWLEVQIQQGTIYYYSTDHDTGTILFSWAQGTAMTGDEKIWTDIIWHFTQQKINFLTEKMWGDIILYPAIDKTILFMINILYTLSPGRYWANLTHYYEFKQYISETTPTQSISTQWNTSIISELLFQIKKGFGETKTNEWVNN